MADRLGAGDLRLVRAARASAGTGVVDGQAVDRRPRCRDCGRPLPLPYAARPWSAWCRHCKTETKSAPRA